MDWQQIAENIRNWVSEKYPQVKKWIIKEYPHVKKWVIKGFPHAVIVAAGMIVVFFCIDRVNKHMGFMTNEFHKLLSMFLALSGIGYSIRYIAEQRRQERIAEKKRIEKLKAQKAARGGQRPAKPAPRPATRPAAGGAPARMPSGNGSARLPAGRAVQQNVRYRQ